MMTSELYVIKKIESDSGERIMILEGKVTRLRPITVADAGVTLKWRLSERAKFLQRGAKTVEQQAKWIESKLDTDELNFIIEYKGRAVGMIALHDISPLHKTLQMGRFLIGEEEWVANAPVGYEAELLLSEHAFETMGMHKIYGDVMEENSSMLKWRAYLGYKQDGVLRDHYVYDGIHKNTVAISILEDEFRKICRPKLNALINLSLRQMQ